MSQAPQASALAELIQQPSVLWLLRAGRAAGAVLAPRAPTAPDLTPPARGGPVQPAPVIVALLLLAARRADAASGGPGRAVVFALDVSDSISADQLLWARGVGRAAPSRAAAWQPVDTRSSSATTRAARRLDGPRPARAPISAPRSPGRHAAAARQRPQPRDRAAHRRLATGRGAAHSTRCQRVSPCPTSAATSASRAASGRHRSLRCRPSAARRRPRSTSTVDLQAAQAVDARPAPVRRSATWSPMAPSIWSPATRS